PDNHGFWNVTRDSTRAHEVLARIALHYSKGHPYQALQPLLFNVVKQGLSGHRHIVDQAKAVLDTPPVEEDAPGYCDEAWQWAADVCKTLMSDGLGFEHDSFVPASEEELTFAGVNM